MKKAVIAGLILASSILAGCASPAVTENMAVPATQLNGKSFDASLKKAITVTDVATYDKYAAFLPATTFKQALVSSLDGAGLGASAGNGYVLKATVSKFELPAFAITMTSVITVDYVLSDAGGKEVFKKSVTAEGVATGGEAFVGTKRLQLAVERSVQKNIGTFIDELATFKP